MTQRILLGLAADVSSSMGRKTPHGRPIDLLNQELESFGQQIRQQPALVAAVEVAIVSFARYADSFDQPTRPFGTLRKYPRMPKLSAVTTPARDGTNIAAGVHATLNLIESRYLRARAEGEQVSWFVFVLLTDGMQSEESRAITETAAVRLRTLTDFHAESLAGVQVVPFVVGLGPRPSDPGTDHLDLFDPKCVGRLGQHDFARFFGLLARTLQSVSSSVPGRMTQNDVVEHFIAPVFRKLDPEEA